jgi:AbrB family looped-hinge helix DNA binding protein
MKLATVTSKGQVTIPKEIRDQLHLKTGHRLRFEVVGDGRVEIRPVAGDIRELRGMLSAYRPARPVSIEEMNEAIRREAIKGLK